VRVPFFGYVGNVSCPSPRYVVHTVYAPQTRVHVGNNRIRIPGTSCPDGSDWWWSGTRRCPCARCVVGRSESINTAGRYIVREEVT